MFKSYIFTGVGTFSPLAAHNTSLAAYLMAMEEGSYFGSGMHWSDVGWCRLISIENHDICIENDGFCIENDEICIKNDGFCI